jgi:hypothetical protein
MFDDWRALKADLQEWLGILKADLWGTPIVLVLAYLLAGAVGYLVVLVTH